MPKKSKTFIFKHQFVLKNRHIDEETLTVPDLVLSMKDVYRKYVATGSIEGLAVSPLVQDERLMEDFPEETVDTLLGASQLRESAYAELKPDPDYKPYPDLDPKPKSDPDPDSERKPEPEKNSGS